jgi:PD-(D/E)XK nuclease superfamily
MPDISNDFTWSKSRHEKFKECRRAYWYAYYGSWGGWEAPSGSPARELYVLKKLSSRWQWAGSLVHDALKLMLARARATGSVKPLDDLLRRTREKARAQWAASREKSYWRESSPRHGLVEHEYGEPVANEEWKRVWDEVVEGSLRAFYGSEAFERIRRVPTSRWLAVDELDSWQFEGTKVWVAVDFAYVESDGKVNLVDWKTGRERSVDHTQVAIYALYAKDKWSMAPDQVVGSLVYLGTPEAPRVSVAADPDALDACRAEMRLSIADMRELLDDAGQNRADAPARFPMLEDRAACRRCPFRRPCGRP